MMRFGSILPCVALGIAFAGLPAPVPPVLAQTDSPSAAGRGETETQRRSAVLEGRRVQPRREDVEGSGQQPAPRSRRAGSGPTGDPRLDAISRDLLSNDRSPPPRPSFDGQGLGSGR
jgi:hypothetical protein